jgi:hypothetical protein
MILVLDFEDEPESVRIRDSVFESGFDGVGGGGRTTNVFVGFLARCANSAHCWTVGKARYASGGIVVDASSSPC